MRWSPARYRLASAVRRRRAQRHSDHVGHHELQMRVADASTRLGSYFELENYSFTVLAPQASRSRSPRPASAKTVPPTLVYTVTRSLNLSSPTVVNITTRC